jgi:hypothetical protein
MIKVRQRWLEADELPAIVIAVAGRAGRDIHALVFGGYPLLTRGSWPRHYFQLQMPPDLHGQAWMRVSMACALSGLRCASLVRATPRGFSARKCATLGCATLTLSTATFFACGPGSANADAASAAWSDLESDLKSDLASTGTGPNCAGGPSGFGESTALERSRVRNSSAPYSAAIAPLPTSSAAPSSAGTTFFRTTLAS